MDIQTLISFIKYLATSNTINFIIMVSLLVYIAVKMNIKNSLEQSVQNVKDTIGKSDDEKIKSEKILQDSQKLLNKLPEDIKNLEFEAQTKTEAFKQKIEETTQKNIEEIQENIKRTILIEEEKFSNNLKTKAVKDSINKAKQNIKNKLTEQPELHYEFVEQSLEEFSAVKL